MIINSFKIYGISNKLDGTEHDMFHWPDDISPEINDELSINVQSDSENDDED